MNKEKQKKKKRKKAQKRDGNAVSKLKIGQRRFGILESIWRFGKQSEYKILIKQLRGK